jgi:hypothetical protein
MNGPSSRVDARVPNGIARRIRDRVGRLLPVAIVLLIVWTVLILITGGVDVRVWGLRLSSRAPLRPLVALLILSAIYLIAFRQRAIAHVAALRQTFDRVSPLIAIAIAASILVIGLRYGSFVAGGSDSYGYVSQSWLFLAGDLIVDQPLARQVSWPHADWTLTPLGYRPIDAGGAIVPTYAPGLPLLMAAATLALTPFGLAGCGPFVVVPLLGGMMVWLTYRLARRVMSRTAGVAAAMLMATSPAFVASLLAPMSDVPVAAFFLAAVVLALAVQPGVEPAGQGVATNLTEASRAAEPRASPSGRRAPESTPRVTRAGHSIGRDAWCAMATGGAVGLAVLVRPNLVPLTIVFAAYVGIVTLRARGWRAGAIMLAWFAAGVLPAIAVVAILNTHWYGAPWKSGYGQLSGYFAWSHGPLNARRYTQWLLDTQTPFILAFAVPFFAWRRVPRDRRAPIVLAIAVVLAIWISYLWYLPFETWDSLRFLIASLPLLIVLALLGSRMILARLSGEARAIVLWGLVLLIVAAQMIYVRDQALLRRWEGEAGIVAAAASSMRTCRGTRWW